MKNCSPLIAIALFLAACAPSTPLTRIEKNHGMFAALPAKHQDLVEQGKIVKGMSQNAVYLALGEPSRKFQSVGNSKFSERWDYVKHEPHVTTSFGFGYGFGGHYYDPYSSFALGPEIYYTPYLSASVFFRHNKVTAYETSTR